MTASSRDVSALPVSVALAGPQRDAVSRWVEGVLGWQVVEADVDRLVPPTLELRDLAAGGGRIDVAVPSVLLVDDDADPESVARVVVGCVPDAVLGWPSGRDRLEQVAREVLARAVPARVTVASLRVGGCAGGVGTTTVALALAGLAAWAGARTLAATRGGDAQALPAAALAGADLWSRADPLPGVGDLRVVELADHDTIPDLGDPAVQAAVIDAGVDIDVDVLVCRPDASALRGLEATAAAAVVVVGEGPVGPRDLTAAVAGRRGVRLPWSVRVARAGLLGRVPAGLPGAWLRRLAPLLPSSLSTGTRRSDRHEPSAAT